MILAGDVGATKILLEVGAMRTGRWVPAFAHRYEVEGAASYASVVAAFLDEWRAAGGSGRIGSAAFGVAGPVIGNRVKMTNRPWTVDGEAIARRFGIARVRVMNDLAASAMGLTSVPSREVVTLQRGRVVEGDPRVVIGVGTGLGIAYLVREGARLRAVGGEGGHAGFAPETSRQGALWRYVHDTVGRASIESIISGHGLVTIHAFVRTHSSYAGTASPMTPEEISHAALEHRDPACMEALDLFVECLASAAGDQALALMARGGVYLVGGIVGKILPALRTARFRESFSAKAPHTALLTRIPVKAVTSERTALLGAAITAA